MIIKVITPERESDLECFLRSCGSSLKTFRYFSNRPLSVVRTHLVSFLGYEGQVPVAYGHLDPEGERIWLGICVAEPYRGKGYGRLMLKSLIEEASLRKIPVVTLSVDAENESARHIYESVGFRLDRKVDQTCFYTLHTETLS